MKQHAITGRSGYRRAWLALAAISSSRAADPFSPSAAWRPCPGYPVAVPDRLPDPAWGWRSWGPVS